MDVLARRTGHPAWCISASAGVRARRVSEREIQAQVNALRARLNRENQAARAKFSELLAHTETFPVRIVTCPDCLAVYRRLRQPGITYRSL